MKSIWIGTVIVLVVTVAFILSGRWPIQVWSPDPRPTSVPEDAIAIPYIAKSRLWARCWVEAADTHCQIFNGAGEVLHDDVFLSYARATAVTASDLMIVGERSGADYLWLKNGEILVPKTNYSEHRRTVDRIIQAQK